MENITLSMQFDYKPFQPCESISYLPDMVEPEQSISVREILQNFSRGNVPNIARVPIYNQESDEIVPDPLRDSNFDYADYSLMLAKHHENILHLQREQKALEQVSKAESAAVVTPNPIDEV